MKVLHVADIHWRGLQRHEEYTRSFENLFEKARKIQPDLIFVGGDVFHTKTQNITPEVIGRLVWMFRGLSQIAPVHMILGNHDGNLTNEDRQDVITPIVEAMNDPNIHLYKKSGSYKHTLKSVWVKDADGETRPYPLTFGVFSCFDKEGWKYVSPQKDAINIAVFHGSITGCAVDSGWTMKENEENVSFFEGYDFVMLGDIHKQQFLAHRRDKNGNYKPWVAYPGSLIQQNFGEEEVKGFLVWDIRGKDDWDIEFVELENKQPFITFPWMGSVKSTIKHLEASRDNPYLKGTRFRVSASQTIPQAEFRQLYHQLVDVSGGSELILKDEAISNFETITTDSVSIHKKSLRNDPTALAKLYREYVALNAVKHPLKEDQIMQGEEMITSYLKKLNSKEDDQAVRDVSWSINGIEFDNTFCYGEGNKIDFTKLNGIVGIFGPNKTGKSSIVGTIMYGLFNTTDRGPMKNSHIINKNKKNCSAKILFKASGVDYFVSRQSVRQEAKRTGTVDEDKTVTSLSLLKLQMDGTTIDLGKENSETRMDTDKVIRKIIGTPNDFLMTAFSPQGGINKFIDEGATKRKEILNRFLDIEVLQELYKYANEDAAILRTKMERFPNSWDQLVKNLKTSIQDKEQMVANLEIEIAHRRNNIDQLRVWILQHESSVSANDIGAAKKLELEMVKQEKELEKITKECDGLTKSIVSLKATIENSVNKINSIEIEKVKQRSTEMSTLSEKIRELTTTFKEEKVVLATQEKSIKKLATVPCGDQFPDCHFIKDSHNDKKLIKEQTRLVLEIEQQLSSLSETLKAYQSEKLAETISTFNNLERTLELSTTELKHNESKLTSLIQLQKQLNSNIQKVKEEKEKVLKRIDILESKEFEEKKLLLENETMNVSALENKKNTALVQMGSEKSKLDQLFIDRKEYNELLQRSKVLDSIENAFSKNGIPAIVLKTQLPAINIELAKILNNIVDFKVTLETDISSNVMDVYIEDGNSRRVIELASGMEKMICSLALRVALINLSSLPKPDMFIIDEGFGVLDEEGVQKCMQLLTLLKSYFRLIVVITHVPAVKEVADKIIEIETSGMESKIKV